MDNEYGDWTDQELAEELKDLDKVIENCLNTIASARKRMNVNMDKREQVLDIMKQRAQNKGWKK